MDIAFRSVNGSGFDFQFDENDLVLGDPIVTGLIHSVFRDSYVSPDELEPDEDPRGHWTSGLDSNAPDGSRLWRHARAKITLETPHVLADELRRCCQWMVDQTNGDFETVQRVTATAQKASNARGRVEAELILHLSEAPYHRRFMIIYDPVGRQYDLREV